MIFGLFKRKEWERLGSPWAGKGIECMFNALATPPAEIWTRDRVYRAIPARDYDALAWSAWIPTDEPDYRPEIFDCDDFAVCYEAALRIAWAKKSRGREALALGYIEALIETTPETVGRHAFIWVMDNAGKIRFIEPQNGGPMTRPIREIYLVEI